MIDSATPFTDDEVESVKDAYPGRHIHLVRRLVATVEQMRRERDEALAALGPLCAEVQDIVDMADRDYYRRRSDEWWLDRLVDAIRRARAVADTGTESDG